MGDLRCSFINKFACGNFRTAAQGSAWRGFLLTHFGFNRFERASRDLLCSTHSGVTCPHPSPHVQHGRVLTLTPAGHFGQTGSRTSAPQELQPPSAACAR